MQKRSVTTATGLIHTLLGVVAAAGLSSAAMAAEWTEQGDAGPVLVSSQEPMCGGQVLTLINGTISSTLTDVPINDLSGAGASVADVDLFEIFLDQPNSFSAQTLGGDSGGSGQFDAALALFDENGLGVYYNNDGFFDDGNALLPPGTALGPMERGVYYLAIFDDEVLPLSALNESGPIFPEVGFPYTALVGPTGPGGAAALLDWFPEQPIVASRGYSILLTGVTCPEPGRFVQSLCALAALAGLRPGRRRGR